MNNDMPTNPQPTATGPKTTEGKRIAARNATTHGLFARDVVLTHLGESAEGYEALLVELAAQLHPTNLLERHYVEKIAAASWRLRRLHRWQAQLLEDPSLSEDEALCRLDRVMRHETTLHRQIDTAVKMLGRDVPHLFESRARRRAQAELHVTEADCRRNASTDWNVMERARRALEPRPLPPQMHERPEMLDNVPGSAPAPPQGHQQEECPNEPASSPTPPELGAGGPPSSPVLGEVASLSEPEGVLLAEPEGVLTPEEVLTEPEAVPLDEICRNEPAPVALPHPLPQGEMAVGAWHAKPGEPEGYPLPGNLRYHGEKHRLALPTRSR